MKIINDIQLNTENISAGTQSQCCVCRADPRLLGALSKTLLGPQNAKPLKLFFQFSLVYLFTGAMHINKHNCKRARISPKGYFSSVDP